MILNERFFWLAFSAFPGVGPVRFALLLSHFGNAKKAWEASTQDLLRINFGEVLTNKLDTFRREFSVEGYAKKVTDMGIATLILTDEKYPKLLKQIPDPPFVLYVRGHRRAAEVGHENFFVPQFSREESQLSHKGKPARKDANRKNFESSPQPSKAWNINKSIAVVGTRKVTSYGREVTWLLTQQLAAAGLTIVSGLALGVDAEAHKAAIEAGGKTIAVLGCGVDCCNPPSNRWLYDKIIDGNGVIISEMPLSHEPNRGLFPARNRIISGLSLGVLVTEGAKDSGSLITARNAAEQGREVFAVPGPITSSLSKGPTELIKKGAKLVTAAEDILEELNIKGSTSRTSSKGRNFDGATGEEKKIIQILENEPLNFDEIVRIIGWPAGTVGSLLSIMEIKGMVKNVGNNRYCLI